MSDTSKFKAVARVVAEEVVQAHLNSCPASASLQASVESLVSTVTDGFNRVNTSLEAQRKEINSALNVSGRHSERLKALERKRKPMKNDDDSDALTPGFVGAPSTAPNPAIDPEDRPLISPKIINNAILAGVIAMATAAGNWIWERLRVPPAVPAVTAPKADSGKADLRPAIKASDSAAVLSASSRTP